MFQLLKRVFGSRPKTNYSELMKKGAIILDVRSKSEYQAGHIKGSHHISIDELDKSLDKLPQDKNKPIITCCASGVRSKAAASLLKATGYKNVYNAGSWSSLKTQITA